MYNKFERLNTQTFFEF